MDAIIDRNSGEEINEIFHRMIQEMISYQRILMFEFILNQDLENIFFQIIK